MSLEPVPIAGGPDVLPNPIPEPDPEPPEPDPTPEPSPVPPVPEPAPAFSGIKSRMPACVSPSKKNVGHSSHGRSNEVVAVSFPSSAPLSR
jgi:hypothetical protein